MGMIQSTTTNVAGSSTLHCEGCDGVAATIDAGTPAVTHDSGISL